MEMVQTVMARFRIAAFHKKKANIQLETLIAKPPKKRAKIADNDPAEQ